MALLHACEHGLANEANRLIDHHQRYKDIDICSFGGIWKGMKKIGDMALHGHRSFKLTDRNSCGDTALQLACKSKEPGMESVCVKLIGCLTDIQLSSHDLTAACYHGKAEAARIIFDRRSSTSYGREIREHTLACACHNPDSASVAMKILKTPHLIEFNNRRRYTIDRVPFIESCRYGKSERVQMRLLDLH